VRNVPGADAVPETACKYLGQLGAMQDSSSSSSSLPYQVVNLRYDLTPIQNISVVATDQGLIPPTSIPVLVHDLENGGGGDREQQEG
jgi:translation initiation factor 2B subunit (eIF-2B alpha/beta/delta family)